MGQQQYREAELKKNGDDWYVEYQYRYPEAIRPKGKRFKRIRAREDVNYIKKRKGEGAAEEYADTVISAINTALKAGVLNPFIDQDAKQAEKRVEEKRQTSVINMNTGLELFIQNRKDRKLSPKTIIDYENLCKWFKTWLAERDLLKEPPDKITVDHVDTFLKDYQELRKWSPRTRNNYKEFVSSIFIFLRDKKNAIVHNPVRGVDQQKTKATKNTYYDTELARNIKAHMMKVDPFMHAFCQYIYYSCSRPKKEARFLKIGDIDLARNLIRVTDGKTGERFVPLCQELREWLEEINIYQYPREYYLFGAGRFGSPKHVSANYFSQRYKPVKDRYGLDRKYSIYGWKHNRCIDLIMAGLSMAEAMQVTGHEGDYASFEHYIRDLGAAMSGKVTGKTVRF